MKRAKRLYILLGVLVAACAGAYGVLKYEERKEQISNSEEVVLQIPAEDVTGLSWEYEGEQLAFHKNDGWTYDEDEAFPVSEDAIDSLLEVFREFSVSFIIEDVEDYGQYGLEEPVCTIQVETEEETYDIQLGDYSTMDSQRYVSIGDGNVYLVQEDPLDSFDAVLSDMIENDETPSFGSAQVQQVQFAGAQEYQLEYQEDSTDTYCADDVYFTERDKENRPLDTDLVDSYLNSISNLSLTDYVTYNATGEELASYGLDDPELTVTVQYTPKDDEDTEENEAVEQTFVLNISRDPEEGAAAEEAEEENGGQGDGDFQESDSENDNSENDDSGDSGEITAYVRVGESPIVYRLTADDYRTLTAAAYDDLRHQEVFTGDFGDITQIDISLEEQEYSITTREEDDETTYFYGDEELEIGEFKSALAALTADSFTDQEPSDKEEIGLTLHLDNVTYPQVTVELYRYDGSSCLAVVDGEPVCLVERSYVVDLIEAVNAIVLN